MSISGHKSTESLAIYQKVNSNEKLRMGMTLGYTLLNQPLQQEILAPAQIQVQSVPNVPKMAIASTAVVEVPSKRRKTEYEPENPIPSDDAMGVAIPEKYQLLNRLMTTST